MIEDYLRDPRCFLTIRELYDTPGPAFVWRKRDATLLTVEPFADRYELLRLMERDLTVFEVDTYREAFGWPEGVVPVAWLRERGPLAVPDDLWLSAEIVLAEDEDEDA